jgi:hypothetical protein
LLEGRERENTSSTINNSDEDDSSNLFYPVFSNRSLSNTALSISTVSSLEAREVYFVLLLVQVLVGFSEGQVHM